jgi:predicted nucleic acid-binding protein
LLERTVVCDTTVLLYLGRIDRLDLLRALFSEVFIPEQVATELDMGRLIRRDTVDPRELGWAKLVSVSRSAIQQLPPNRLGVGERAVISYAESHACDVVGLDDYQARALAEQMGLAVVGTLGVLLLAKRHGLIPAVRPLVDAIKDQGFRLDTDLYQVVLTLADEAG